MGLVCSLALSCDILSQLLTRRLIQFLLMSMGCFRTPTCIVRGEKESDPTP